MLLPMIVYLIILPIAFLMNTSDNKHRIVEVGWKYIFLNVTGNKYFFSRFYHAPSDQSISQNVSNSETNKKSNNHIFMIFQTTTNKGVDSDKGNKGKLITIPNYCASRHYVEIRNQKIQNKMDALDVKKLPKISSKQEIFQELISKLIHELNDEERYIDIFRQFVRLVDDNNIRYNSNSDFKDHPSRETEYVFQRCVVKAKNIQKFPIRDGRKSEKSGVGTIQSNEGNNNIFSKQMCLKGQKASRRNIRNKVLGKFNGIDVENDSFKLWAENLINVEESFIK